VVGELAVGLPVRGNQVETVEPLEDRPDHAAGHPVAAVEDHLQRPDRGGIDERQRALLELRVDVDLLDRARRGVRRRQPAEHELAHVADPRVA
jgi:hypothetical protein